MSKIVAKACGGRAPDLLVVKRTAGGDRFEDTLPESFLGTKIPRGDRGRGYLGANKIAEDLGIRRWWQPTPWMDRYTKTYAVTDKQNEFQLASGNRCV